MTNDPTLETWEGWQVLGTFKFQGCLGWHDLDALVLAEKKLDLGPIPIPEDVGEIRCFQLVFYTGAVNDEFRGRGNTKILEYMH